MLDGAFFWWLTPAVRIFEVQQTSTIMNHDHDVLIFGEEVTAGMRFSVFRK